MYLGSGIRLWIGLASLLACVGAGCRSSTIDARPSVAAPASDEEALRLLQENLGNHPLKGDLPWQQGRDYGAESEGFFVTAGAPRGALRAWLARASWREDRGRNRGNPHKR